MTVQIELNNQTQSPLTEDFFSAVAEKVFQYDKLKFLSEKNITISFALVSEEEIKLLNKQYRKIDSATDVLSFPEYERLEDIKSSEGKDLFLGEIILCYNDISNYAKENKIILKEELTRVTAHGILHLLGYQHGDEMFSIQESILTESE